jgi:hypothetical protein
LGDALKKCELQQLGYRQLLGRSDGTERHVDIAVADYDVVSTSLGGDEFVIDHFAEYLALDLILGNDPFGDVLGVGDHKLVDERLGSCAQLRKQDGVVIHNGDHAVDDAEQSCGGIGVSHGREAQEDRHDRREPSQAHLPSLRGERGTVQRSEASVFPGPEEALHAPMQACTLPVPFAPRLRCEPVVHLQVQ